MIYPLVRELAVDGIPVTVTCRVLGIARQPHYRWLAHPVTEAELVWAYRANTLFDAHRDDPEFGHRILADEARAQGQEMAERTACLARLKGVLRGFAIAEEIVRQDLHVGESSGDGGL
ncbi:hypothetical protein [Ornithinimicrobium sp. INDO-MA30-4]|uniref:hypothetical protein n=1 Tax=Ornithinimicrobium sp. INDO-MA30-4 TaxID=2908651 RepID=UPI001F17C541|nr:hypothetical protein [Ornithinimicrobium sp. INDO-MA30-4]UJH71735.1 hypothetical protein L0A91_16760 [Ornithinimicrobium sp. INDO-MA30-4]